MNRFFSPELPSLKLTANAPENGWLEDDPFLLGFGKFSGAFAVSFKGVYIFLLKLLTKHK